MNDDDDDDDDEIAADCSPPAHLRSAAAPGRALLSSRCAELSNNRPEPVERPFRSLERSATTPGTIWPPGDVISYTITTNINEGIRDIRVVFFDP